MNTFTLPPQNNSKYIAGLYVHIPFCRKRCPYCSFYSTTDSSKQIEYLKACLKELKHISKLHADADSHLVFDTIYIGGGTPSTLSVDILADFINNILKIAEYSGGEFTVEFNPESTTYDLLKSLQHSPISRISIGVQSLNDNILNILGRVHNSKEAVDAYYLTRETLPNIEINLDMMYDIPNVPFNTIQDTIKQLISLSPEHISAYSYMPDTRYLTDISSENPFQMEGVTQELALSGYNQYEISNYCKGGHHAKHNNKYWQMKPYYGIGSSAHSMVEYVENSDQNQVSNLMYSRVRYSNISDIDKYMQSPTSIYEIDIFTDHDYLIKESLVFGLRMNSGVNLNELEKQYGQINSTIMQSLKKLEENKLLIINDNAVSTTPKGILLLDSIMEYLW